MSQDAGKTYEEKINRILRTAKLQPPGFIHKANDNINPDAVFIKDKKIYSLETKHISTTAFGSLTVKHDRHGWILEGDPILASAFKYAGLTSRLDSHFKGKIPFIFSVQGGRKMMSPAQIKYDIEEFGGDGNYIYVPVKPDLASNYYAAKNVNYIQIQHDGMFHFKNNPAKLPTTKLSLTSLQIEFRIKTESSGKVGYPYYRFVAQLNNIQTISKKSKVDIDKSIDFLK